MVSQRSTDQRAKKERENLFSTAMDDMHDSRMCHHHRRMLLDARPHSLYCILLELHLTSINKSG